MRTTIELDHEQRARLLELAARRREKGFSRIIAEALDAYLRSVDDASAAREAALLLRGSLTVQDAERLRTHAAVLRESWR